MSNSEAFESIRYDCEATLSSNQLAPLQSLHGSTILLTGGTGFMGTWTAGFVDFLSKKHNIDIQLHLLSRQKTSNAYLEHLAKQNLRIKLIRNDILSAIEIPKETNYIIHGAANPNHAYHASKPIETMTTIVEGTFNLLRSLETLSHLKKVINISSGFVYNLRNVTEPISETTDTAFENLNQSSYVRSKKFAEYIFDQYQAHIKYPTCHVRPFAFIGPFQSLETPWAHLNFLRDIIHNRNIRILGDGKSFRSYLYGSDLAYVLLAGLTSFQTGSIYNVGHPQGVTLRLIAEAMIAASGKKLAIQSGILPYNDSNSFFVPHITRLSEHINFKPLSLEESVQRTVNWYVKDNSFNDDR